MPAGAPTKKQGTLFLVLLLATLFRACLNHGLDLLGQVRLRIGTLSKDMLPGSGKASCIAVDQVALLEGNVWMFGPPQAFALCVVKEQFLRRHLRFILHTPFAVISHVIDAVFQLLLGRNQRASQPKTVIVELAHFPVVVFGKSPEFLGQEARKACVHM